MAQSLSLTLLLLLAALGSFAQDQTTRVEIGGEFGTIRQTPDGGGGKNFPGFGGRFDWNFNRRLALEGEVDYFPEHAEALFLVQGGQTLQAVFGLRAKVIETRRLSVFGLIRPGLLHFNDVLSYNTNPDATYQTKSPTYFELNLGGGIEYYVSPRWALRADISGNPYRVTNEHFTNASGNELAIGEIEDTTRLSFGVAYRPGVLRDNEREENVSGNWEFGPLFSTMVSVREGPLHGVRTDLGLGGFASYRLWGVFYLDSDVLYFPANRSPGGPQDGGEILQGLFGVKGGIRRNHYGFFGKVRPGFNSYSQAVTSATDNNGGSTSFTYGRSTNVVLDLGGIVEFYPGERSTLRLEAGDTHIFYGNRSVDVNGAPTVYPGGGLKHSIEFIVGYGWRF
ncbi:MAG TPA: outer membrane beta-barrel protein [Candidatus Acidoferrum sp.]